MLMSNCDGQNIVGAIDPSFGLQIRMAMDLVMKITWFKFADNRMDM